MEEKVLTKEEKEKLRKERQKRENTDCWYYYF